MSLAPHEPNNGAPIATSTQGWASISPAGEAAMSLAPAENSNGAPDVIATSANRWAPVSPAEAAR